MRRPERNTQAIRGYLDAFERRFVQTREGVIYLPGETGAGVKLPPPEAASIIAGMRASMIEAGERHPLWGQDAFFLAGVAICVTIMLGAITGYHRLAVALIVPICLASFVLGPFLGNIRVWLAWQRGLQEVDRRLEPYERLAVNETRRHVRPNPARAAFFVVAVLFTAIIAGLMAASATAPRYGAVAIDRFLAGVIGWAAAIVIVLALLYKAIDAFVRPRMSEAAIGLAAVDRRHLTIEDDEAAWRARIAEPAAPAPVPERPLRRAYPPVTYGRKRRL